MLTAAHTADEVDRYDLGDPQNVGLIPFPGLPGPATLVRCR